MHPQIETALAALADGIPDDTMQKLNYEVDENGSKASDVAREFLVTNGLIASQAKPGDGGAGTVTVGGKQFTEQEILGEIVAITLECKTNLKVVRKLNLGGTMICFNALRAGDLDLYVEYTGTGLVNILKRDVITDPDEAYAAVKKSFADEYALIWLDPLGFNNTYTLTMRRGQAGELGIATISQLADVLSRGSVAGE